jgi:hypothetical protein
MVNRNRMKTRGRCVSFQQGGIAGCDVGPTWAGILAPYGLPV